MNIGIQWTKNMQFTATHSNSTLVMDAKAPIGKGEGFTPKELVVLGMAGCTGMDVVAMMKKFKQEIQSLTIDANVETSTSGHPAVFTKATLIFNVTGNVDSEKLIDAVRQSQTQYCGVSAMLVKSFPIDYQVILNETKIASGEARFGS